MTINIFLYLMCVLFELFTKFNDDCFYIVDILNGL